MLELIEGKMGLWSFLDEESRLPKGSDSAFTCKINTVFQQHVKYEIIKTRQSRAFGICHFAGNVVYDTTGFLKKNRNTMVQDIVGLMKESKVALVQEMYHDRFCPEDDMDRTNDLYSGGALEYRQDIFSECCPRI